MQLAFFIRNLLKANYSGEIETNRELKGGSEIYPRPFSQYLITTKSLVCTDM
jgi:hypothetical protein